jgi:hypothetical protein
MAGRRARLIGLDLLLVVLAAVGVLQAAAKDDTSTAEGVIFWISVVALPILLLALLALLIGGVRALVRRDAPTG